MFGHTIDVTVECPEDEVEFRLRVRLLECAINSEQIDLLQHEEILLVPGDLPNTPIFTRVPDDLLEPLLTSRMAVQDLLGTKFTSLSDIIKLFLTKTTIC